MTKVGIIGVGQALCLSAVLACIAAMPTVAAADIPSTTPQGVTLVEVVRELEYAQPEILWIRPGDANGHTLFAFAGDEAGVSNCTGECAKEFQPLLAPRGAKAFGDWSVVERSGGAFQWAYQTKPLYTWTAETVPGEVATNVGLTETAGAKLAQIATEAGDLMPPKDWTVVRFDPAASMTLPDSFDVGLLYSANAVVLTDAEGFTLYTQNAVTDAAEMICGEDGCDPRWTAITAPALAKTTGHFSVVTRRDGLKQWAYRGKPLYRFNGDQLPGDAHGAGVDDSRSLAKLSENFHPPEVSTAYLDGYGATLTKSGMTLYGGYPFEKRWGGRNLRDTFRNAYYKGKKLRGAACVGECLNTWRPFLAPENAESGAFWEPIRRDDGTNQWAYKGYALYTYSGDTAPGEQYGQATYDFVFNGDGYSFERLVFLQDIANGTMKRANTNGGVGIYWNIAKP